MAKFSIQKPLEWIYTNFKEDTSKMLIATGTLGWVLSSAAQIGAILTNSKISDEKKSFLLPQEILDAVINIGAFVSITLLAKKVASKLVSTGKILPKSTRDFLNLNYKSRVGKISFDVDDVIKNAGNKTRATYDSYKNVITTAGTVGASILACNVVTPFIRNNYASKVQNSYIESKKYQPMNYSSDMRI